MFIGFEKTVQMLIEKGADINAVDDRHQTALYYAALNGNTSNKFLQLSIDYFNKFLLDLYSFIHRICENCTNAR